MKKLIRELEEAVVDAWPASDTEDLDGWLLRASGGPTRRGNSASTLDEGTELELPRRIDAAERWYRERKRTPSFQIGPCVAPSSLDEVLAERGYGRSGDTVFAIASAEAARDRLRAFARARDSKIESKPGADWLAVATAASRFADTLPILLSFFQRLGSRCRFFTTYDARGRPVANCFTISSEERLGIYGMLTLPEARGKGAASALLHATASSAIDQQMRELYLMVDEDNEPARKLYARAGFEDVYRYFYRFATPATAPSTE